MFRDVELAQEIERSAAIRRQTALTKAEARLIRSGVARSPRRTSLLLLSLAETLITAHRTAKAEGDGTTIDYIHDALVHVGKRLAEETNAHGPSARAIIGYYRQGPPRRLDRNEPLPEQD